MNLVDEADLLALMEEMLPMLIPDRKRRGGVRAERGQG